MPAHRFTLIAANAPREARERSEWRPRRDGGAAARRPLRQEAHSNANAPREARERSEWRPRRDGGAAARRPLRPEAHSNSEDAALKRARVARLALRLPRVLDELRTGAIHLTGLFLLDRYLNDENAEELLAEVRGKSRRELEKLFAIRFPRPDVPSRIEALGTTPTLALGAEASGWRLSSSGPSPWFSCPGTGTETSTARGGEPCGDSRSRVEPLSAERYRVEFTASATLRAKLEQA